MTASTTRAVRRAARSEEPEWVVWLAVIALLAAGLLLRGMIEGRTERFSQAGVSLNYPAAWSLLRDEQAGQILHVADAFATAQAPANVSVRQVPAAELGWGAQTLGDLAMLWSRRQAEDLLGYSVLNLEPIKLRGQDAVAVDYAYVVQPPGGGLPVVTQAEDILLRQGDKLTIVSFSAAADAYAEQAGVWRKVLASLDVQ